jgi:hypothetical protein
LFLYLGNNKNKDHCWSAPTCPNILLNQPVDKHIYCYSVKSYRKNASFTKDQNNYKCNPNH